MNQLVKRIEEFEERIEGAIDRGFGKISRSIERVGLAFVLAISVVSVIAMVSTNKTPLRATKNSLEVGDR